MKVGELMKHEASRTRADATLREAGRIMAEVGCGFLPVVDAHQRVVGVITDRDLAMTVTTADQRPASIAVENAMTREIHVTRSNEDLSRALRRMAEARVRRLPVVDTEGRLEGILSLDDVILATGSHGTARFAEAPAEEVLGALKAICNHPVLALELNR